MLLTPEVSHAPMSWSKAEAEENISSILITPEVSHATMLELKEEAPSNIASMSITAPTLQPLMS